MNSLAAKHLRSVLKTTREMQQFKDFPLIFGNSNFPDSMLYSLEKSRTDAACFEENELKSLYGDFCKLISARQLSQRPEFIDASLFSSLQLSIGQLNKAGMKVKSKECPDFEYKIIDYFTAIGPFVLVKELNPQTKYLHQLRYGQFKLATNLEPYESVLKHKFEKRDQSAWEGLVSKIDFTRLASKVSLGFPLENKDAIDLISFHIYLSSIQPTLQIVLVAIKGGSLVTIENRNGEAEDGEEQPYVHLLTLEKIKLDKEDRVVTKNFVTNKWVISEVDFVMNPDYFKQTNNEEETSEEEEENEKNTIDFINEFKTK